ncbi:Mucin-1 [Dirofilaria immitis]
MRSEILIYLLISFLSAAAQSVESENNTVETVSSSSPSSSLPTELKSNLELEALEQNFMTQKLLQTTTPRKNGFPLPEIKRAREFGAPDFAILEQESSSLAPPPPFIAKIDRNSTIEIQSNHPKYQNVTHEENSDNYETKEISISGLREISQLSSTIGSTKISSDETGGITEISKRIEDEEDTLPPEVRAEDPFATVTEELIVSTSSTSQENILHMIQETNSLTTADFPNNFNNTLSKITDVNQTDALHENFDTDTIDRTSSIIASSLKPEQERITIGITDATEMALKIQEMLQETKITMPDEQATTAAFGTIVLEIVPDSFPTTVADITTPIKQTTESPMLHPVVSHTSNASSDEKVITTNQNEIITDGTTAVDISWKPGKQRISLVTESDSIATSVEIEHRLVQPKISTTSVKLPSTNKFNTDKKSYENENEQDDEHVHDDESVFVGDKTLFIQDGIIKQHFNVMHSTSEENFGVSGFSRIEELGPEATEKIHQTQTNVTPQPSTLQSLSTEFKVRAGIPNDLVKHSQDHHNGGHTSAEGLQIEANSLKESGQPKDISVIDDSFYINTDTEETASTFKPTNDERKLESEPPAGSEPTPQHVPFLESEVLKSSKANPVTGFEPKVEQEITAKFRANEGAYKIPFSFHITSIDYIPEFGDPSSGKYKKLRDQLLPDLEEIFGSIFGHAYEGIRLVSFLKGSVAVDGIVYTSIKPDNMEQSATEFEEQITAKNSRIGGNDVDPRSILLDGYVSKNYIERIHEGYTSNNTSSYIVGGGIAIGVLAILLVAFIIIAMNNRRTNGTLKLKEENIAMVEKSRSMWPNGTSPVNLMAYGNGRVIHGGTTTNTQLPMVMVGSQMTAINTHAIDRAIQPCV